MAMASRARLMTMVPFIRLLPCSFRVAMRGVPTCSAGDNMRRQWHFATLIICETSYEAVSQNPHSMTYAMQPFYMLKMRICHLVMWPKKAYHKVYRIATIQSKYQKR